MGRGIIFKPAIKSVFQILLTLLLAQFFVGATKIHQIGKRPNILFIMTDDLSWVDFGAYGCKVVKTPVFDELARKGVLFKNAFSAAPNCSASRASILTGRYPCELEEAGTHNSYFPGKFKVYQDLLEKSGYQTGYTGKGWSPGNFEILGWDRNPAGPEYNDILFDEVPYTGIHEIDIASNFREFLKTRDNNRPFSMWIGSREPHGPREVGSGIKAGKDPDDVVVPGFLPDTPDMRSQLLDYYVEIEWFDKQLGIILEELEKSGELDNTLVLVTCDNGMPFPRAKTQLYEFGTHMAMVAAWPASIKEGRKVEDLVNFVDLAPTFLEAAGVPVPGEMSGKSFLDILLSDKEGRIDPRREVIYTCHERHDHQRFDNLGFPMRAIRDYRYLYIRNFRTERWPLGNPEINGARERYPDTPEGQRLFELTYAKKPAEELYDIIEDPYCLRNLASETNLKDVRDKLRNRLDDKMIALKDPRMLGYGDIFDSYPRNSLNMNPAIGGFKEPRTYNLKYRVDKPEIRIYPLPAVYPPSRIYSLEVNGIDVPVTEFMVKNDIQYHYAHFSFSGTANLRIKLKEKVRSFLIRPIPFEVSAEAIGNRLNFTLHRPRYLLIDINEQEKLIVLADPLEKDIPVPGAERVENILDYDVDQTGQAESTGQIQEAIDRIHQNGGGTLYFPPGIYKTRTIHMKDNVNIYLAGGSVIRGVTLGMQAYEHMYNILYDSIFVAGTRDGVDFKHNDGTGDWEDIIVKNIFVDECWGKPFNMQIREGGSIQNVIIENYSCKSTGNKSFIDGLNEDLKISSIIIKNLVLNGEKIKSPESGNFEINQFTNNIRFQ